MHFYENEPVSLYLKDLTLIQKYSSSKQSVALMSHPWLGKVLIINGEIQHIEKYQSLYHELLVHLPAAFVPSIGSVLILGGGSLFAAYEALKYPSVKTVVLCDHDHTVLELMREHYSHAKKVLSDPRFCYIEQDAREYIRETNQKFDLVINDCFNLATESSCDGTSYFMLLSNLCTGDGVCADIIYRHIFDKQVTADTLTKLRLEKQVALSLVTVPEYPGILHLETIWGKSACLSQRRDFTVNDFQNEVLTTNNSPFQIYNPGNLPFYLYLPPYIKEMFNL